MITKRFSLGGGMVSPSVISFGPSFEDKSEFKAWIAFWLVLLLSIPFNREILRVNGDFDPVS